MIRCHSAVHGVRYHSYDAAAFKFKSREKGASYLNVKLYIKLSQDQSREKDNEGRLNFVAIKDFQSVGVAFFFTLVL